MTMTSQQVRGFCQDKTNPEIFDDVNVYGNIYDSELHHMNFAVYTYGHQQGDWRRNRVHSNSGYGTGQSLLFTFFLFPYLATTKIRLYDTAPLMYRAEHLAAFRMHWCVAYFFVS